MHDLLRDEGFWIALVVALGSSIVVIALRDRHWLSRVGFEAGAVAALAVLVALLETDRTSALSLAGLALLAVGAIVTRRARARWRLVAAIPGAALIAVVLQSPVPDWAAVACFVAIVVVVPCAIAVDAGAPRLLPPLLAITAIGMWGTTPETEHTRILVGALVGAVVFASDRRLHRGAGGTAVLVGIMVWAAITDGYPRRGAVVGALACFGVVVLLPLLRRSRVPRKPLAIGVVLVVQAVGVLVSSRVAGLESAGAEALLISAAVWAAAAVLLRFRLSRRR